MSSLYDGLDTGGDKKAKSSVAVEGWSSGIKLLQSQIQLKRATGSLVGFKKDKSRAVPVSSAAIAPVVDLSSRKKATLTATILNASPERGSEAELKPMLEQPHLPWGDGYKGTTLEKSSPLLFGEVEVKDEYNPMLPNDYELLRRQRMEEKARKREHEERERRKREKFDKPVDDVDEHEDRRDREHDRSRLAGAAIAPPTFLVEEDKRILEEPQMPPPVPSQKGMGVAAKIMEKYGYRRGQGLGKQEQGMSTALQVEKVSKTTAKIIHEKDGKNGDNPPSITEILRNPTKVVLLKNMVGPGEVDSDLEPEIKSECSKYGEVYACTVYEVPNPSGDDDSVRVFLEFAKVEQAIKAVVDLNGRYFGGRMVHAAFYDVDRFRKHQLAFDD